MRNKLKILTWGADEKILQTNILTRSIENLSDAITMGGHSSGKQHASRVLNWRIKGSCL